MSEDEKLYTDLLHLEQLESLLEDLDESDGSEAALAATPEFRERMRTLNLSNVDEVRARIAEIHRELDAGE